jgi:hypothetical protein
MRQIKPDAVLRLAPGTPSRGTSAMVPKRTSTQVRQDCVSTGSSAKASAQKADANQRMKAGLRVASN